MRVYGLGFCKGPTFRVIAYRLGPLDIPDRKKLVGAIASIWNQP